MNFSFNIIKPDDLNEKDINPLYCDSGVSGSSRGEMESCVSYLHIPISHNMAPLSHLLVYYVRENGEGVTDSVQIPIQPDFENQVCTMMKRTATLWFCSMYHFSIDTAVVT